MLKSIIGIHLIIGAVIQVILVLGCIIASAELRKLGDYEGANENSLRTLISERLMLRTDKYVDLIITLILLANIVVWPFQVAYGIVLLQKVRRGEL